MTRCFGLLFVLACTLLAACAPSPELAAGEQAQSTVYRDHTTQGRFLVEVRSDPDPIPLNRPFELLLRVFEGSDGRTPRDDVTITVEGWMPGHGHGMLRKSQVEGLGNGGYRVQGMLFHMAGSWELRIGVAWRHEDVSSFSVLRDEVVFEVEL